LPTRSCAHARVRSPCRRLEGEGSLREPLDRGLVQLEAAGAAHRIHELIGNRSHHKNLFLADAEQVVVEAPALDDGPRGQVEVGGLIHHHRRIAWAGRDHALAVLARRSHHHRAAGDAQQRNLWVLEHLRRGFNCGL